jgi:hypothetical protein
MFAKLAQMLLRGVGNVRQARATTGNRAAFRFGARPGRTRRPGLVCHWQAAPATGTLECTWEAAHASPTHEPRPVHKLEKVRRLNDARAAAQAPLQARGVKPKKPSHEKSR